MAIVCEKCGGDMVPMKKGLSVAKGTLGTLAFGLIGLAAAGIGSNKLQLICTSCGHTYTQGGLEDPRTKAAVKAHKVDYRRKVEDGTYVSYWKVFLVFAVVAAVIWGWVMIAG